MNRAFGEHTEVMLSIAEMAVNLDPETVDMRFMNRDSFGSDGSRICILGHARERGISPSNNLFEKYQGYFGGGVTLTPKQIGYFILDKLKIMHI